MITLGATASSLLLGGCGEEGPGEENAPGGEEGAEDEARAEQEDPNGSDGGEDAAADGGGDEGSNESNESEEAADEWGDTEEIVLSGYVSEWLGLEPNVIDQEENPTLVLYEGREYDVTWQNEDGREHSLAIMNEDDEYFQATEFVDEEGESVTMTFVAIPELSSYICENHPDTMTGDIEIRSE